MKSLTLTVLAVFSATAYAIEPMPSEEPVDILTRGTRVELISEVAPVYPRRALHDHVEGWAIVRYEIKPDGTTENIEVEQSSIEDYFDDAAVNAAKTKIYKPATLQGKPVRQGNLQARYLFMFKSADGGVSKSFLRTYRKASDAISEADLNKAKSLIDKLDGDKKKLLAEVCYLDMLKVRYFTKTGDDKAALRHLKRALVIADDVASKEIYVNLLKQAILDEGKANNYHASLEHYNTLLEIDKNLAADDPAHKVVTLVRQKLNGNANILTSGKISACKRCKPVIVSWARDLNRNRFLIDQVVGEVTEIEVQCRNGSVSMLYQPDMVWSVNKEWGECFLRVFGEEGTTLRLVELPYQG